MNRHDTRAATAMYSARLQRLLLLQHHLQVSEARALLLSRAITATLGDLMDLDADEQAREVLRGVRA